MTFINQDNNPQLTGMGSISQQQLQKHTSPNSPLCHLPAPSG